MEILLETKLEAISSMVTKASVHIELCGGGFTVSNILLRRLEMGSWRVTMPLNYIQSTPHPVVTMQGALKQAVFQALREDHQTLRTSRERRMQNSRTFSDVFPLPTLGESVQSLPTAN